MKLVCENCGVIPHALLDGEDVGGVALRDIGFMVSIVNGAARVRVEIPGDEEYLSPADIYEYIAEAVEAGGDFDGGFEGWCVKCDGVVVLET